MEDRLAELIERAEKQGASHVEARFQDHTSSLITVENGLLKSYESQKLRGIGFRVLVKGSWGYASSSSMAAGALSRTLRRAVKQAKAASKRGPEAEIGELQPAVDDWFTECQVDPFEVPPEDQICLAVEANKASQTSDLIKNTTTRIGAFKDGRILLNSEGTRIKTTSVMVGLGHLSVAKLNGEMERVTEQRSRNAGFEYVQKEDWTQFTRDVSELAEKAVRAETPKAGTFEAVADPELIGLILHEAFGHASEADLITTKESVLEGRLGTAVASPHVTIFDEGIVDGGYCVPYDDEGTPKRRTVIVEDGVLRGYLQSRQTANKLGTQPTGNARAMDFESNPIVRQTNYYMKPGDESFEELVGGVKHGYYIRGKGAGGGQVDVGGGTFTFAVGPSYLIEGGELKGMVRGTTVSGVVLETLKTIDGIGSDLTMRTSVFGGCGKGGQLVKVGSGGPHVRIGKMTIGGSA